MNKGKDIEKEENQLRNSEIMKNDPMIENRLLEIFQNILDPEIEQYVLGLNTLGCEKGISEEKRMLTFKFLRLFESKWEHDSKNKVIKN